MVTSILCRLIEKALAAASLNDEASMVCMDGSSSCILMFADGAYRVGSIVEFQACFSSFF